MNKLAYEIDGKIEYLPVWYSLRSDEEIEEAKRIVIEAAKNPIKYDNSKIEIDEVEIRKQLRSEFNEDQIDEIIRMLYDGRTLDSAMQSMYA